MSTITITTNEQLVNNTDKLKLQLIFAKLTGTAENYTAKEKGVKVANWGEISLNYDLEDAFLVPANYRFILTDANNYLDSLFFENSNIKKDAKVIVYLNSNVEYKGTIQEDGLMFDSGNKTISINANADTSLINKRELWDKQEESQPYNPFNYSSDMNFFNSSYSIGTILTDIYKLVDPYVTVEMVHDWKFKGWTETSPNVYEYSENIIFTELKQRVNELYFDKSKGCSNCGDILRKLAIDWCSFTGMIHEGKAFFKKLFHYNSNNLQELGKVLSHKKQYQYGVIDFIKIIVDTGDGYPQIYFKGTDTQLSDRFLERDTLVGFFERIPDPDAYGSLGSNVIANHNGNIYRVQRVKDNNLLNGEFVESGVMLSEFWYRNRGFIDKCRTDLFTLIGIQYDFLKDFNYNGKKYQPIGLKKNLAKNQTEIEAIYLGDL